MKILIKESQYKVLLEQYNPNILRNIQPNIQKAYNEIVDGAKYWMGTDKNKILKAFDNIKNNLDLKILFIMFGDGRTGYKSFEEMINEEYDMMDFKDIVKLKDKLISIGKTEDYKVVLTFQRAQNNYGMNFFMGGAKISYKHQQQVPPPTPKTNYKTLQQVPKECSSKWQPHLEKAKNYWIQWLLSPITITKFLINWQKVEKNMTLFEVGNIFKKYIDSFKGLKLYYYNSKLIPEFSTAYAFVDEIEPKKIYVNCSQNDPDPYATLIHEIQHLLYYIKPLNPDVQIGNVFVDSNTKKSTPKTFFKGNSNSNANDVTNKIISASKKFGVPITTLTSLLFDARDYDKKDPGYSCDETEKMSNIMAIRNLFGVKPGQNITKEMLLPYIKGEKFHDDVSFILYCWVLKGFPDLDGMLNKMNQLAYQNTKKDTFNPLNPIKNQNNNSNTRTV